MFREIYGLESCTVSTSPHPTPHGATPAQRRGLSYERKVGAGLVRLAKRIGAKVDLQVPLAFCDFAGPGLAIADFILTYADVTIVGETKLTWTPEAGDKLRRLYLPLVAALHRSLRLRGLVICRNLTTETPLPLLPRLSAVLTAPTISTLSWLGRREVPLIW